MNLITSRLVLSIQWIIPLSKLNMEDNFKKEIFQCLKMDRGLTNSKGLVLRNSCNEGVVAPVERWTKWKMWPVNECQRDLKGQQACEKYSESWVWDVQSKMASW